MKRQEQDGERGSAVDQQPQQPEQHYLPSWVTVTVASSKQRSADAAAVSGHAAIRSTCAACLFWTQTLLTALSMSSAMPDARVYVMVCYASAIC